MSGKSKQLDLIAAHLLTGSPIDPVVAGSLGIWRLSLIIYRLRRRGWPIVAERAHNNGMASYRLLAGWQPTASLN